MANNWTGSTMIASSKAMQEAVKQMEELNRTLMVNVATYGAAMQDAVKDETEAMIKRLDIILKDIREEIDRRAQKVEEAGQKLSALEMDAKNKINGF